MNFFGKISGKGYGCIANRDIEKGTLLLSVLFEDCIIGKDEIELMEKILLHYGDNSKWTKYIDHVLDSKVLEYVPIMWSDLTELKMVCSLRALMSVVEDTMVLVNDYVPRWVIAFVLSRSFSIQGGDGGIAIVPFGDMFNHSSNGWNTRLIEGEYGYMFYAEQFIHTGDEIFNHYGEDFDVMTMMITHGFFDDVVDSGNVYVGIDDGVIVFPSGEYQGDLIDTEVIKNDLVKKLAKIDICNFRSSSD